MPLDEYHSWLRFYAEEPWGDVRADLRSAITSALIARTMGGRKGATPMDYMPVVAAQRDADEKALDMRQRTAIIRQTFEGNLGGVRVRRVKLERS